MVSTRKQHKQETYARVINAATYLFLESGFESTTVRDIATSAGVSPGTVISVGDKNALLIKVFDAMISTEHSRRATALADDKSTTKTTLDSGKCVDRLAALVEPFVSLFLANLDLSRAYASVLVSGTQETPLFTALADTLISEFAAAIVAHGCTPVEDSQAKSRAIYSAYIGTLFMFSGRGTTDSSTLRADLRTTFTAICTCKE